MGRRRLRTVTLLTATLPLTLAGRADAQASPYTLLGDAAGDLLGSAVAAVADVDGDGVAEIAVGAYQGHPLFLGAGYARLVSGASGAVLHTVAGDAPGDAFGWSVAGVGDVDADGLADWAVGAHLDDDGGADAGRVTVRSGLDGAALLTVDGAGAGDWLGWAVAGLGDVNADGRADLLVGAPQTGSGGAGYALVVSGLDGSTLFTLTGVAPGDRLGASVAAAGDLDGDRVPDLVVGAPGSDAAGTDAGRARVHSGADAALLRTFDGPRPGAELGRAVGGVGDVDGDGVPDLILAAPLDDLGLTELSSGSVVVASGATGAVLHAYAGESDDHMGLAVGGAGDVDGDGVPDFMMARRHDLDFEHPGVALVHSGATGMLHFLLVGDADEDRFGHALAALGDVDGDGLDDVVVGAPQIRQAGAGYARVVRGCAVGLGTPACFGVGCPCGNDDAGAGCANSTGVGARLAADGTGRVSADDLVLTASDLPPDSQGLVYMGDALAAAPFFDGLQCALGTTHRFLHCAGSSGTEGVLSCTGLVAAAAGLIDPGEVWWFHAWYRDVAPGAPCGTGANLTHALGVCFAP